MWKILAILAVAATLIISVSGQPNKTANEERYDTKQGQPSVVMADSPNKQASGNADQTKSGSDPPTGDASIERSHWWANSEWWLVIIAGFTGCVIGWQAWETRNAANGARKAAEAALAQAEHIVTSERAWMVATMKTDQNNFVFAPMKGNLPIGATCIFTNKGKTPAFILEAGGAIELLEEEESLPDNPPPYDPSNVMKWDGLGIPISPEVSFLRFVSKPVQDPIRIMDGSKVFWAYGYTKYRDAFKGEIRETRYCFRYQAAQPSIGMNAQFVIQGPPNYNRAT